MSKKLKKRVGMMAMGAVLAAASIGILSGTAKAQEVGVAPDLAENTQSASQNTASPTTVVQPVSPDEVAAIHLVVPGDTLWSIAQEHLGQNATPQQVANEVERIYELNRDQIGDDPNLIFAGQQFLVSSGAQPTSATTPPAAATPAAANSEMATTPPPPVAAAEEPATAQEPVPADGQPADEQALTTPAVDEPDALPDAPEANAASPVAETASTSTEPNGDSDQGRRLLGLGAFLLSFGAAGLLVWRLAKELRQGTKKTNAGMQAEGGWLLEDLKRQQDLEDLKRERTRDDTVEKVGGE